MGCAGSKEKGKPAAATPAPRLSIKNEDLNQRTVENADVTSSEAVDCTFTNCTLKNVDFRGECKLNNCTVRETDIYGTVTVSGGAFEWSEVKPGGRLVNQGGCKIKDVDNYVA